MESMNKYLAFILLLFLFGCSEVNRFRDEHKLSKKESIADEILANTAARLKKERELQPCGSGGQMMNQVKMLELAFVYNKPVDIEEGRKLLVYAVETFVSMINKDERIHPYLNNYPFESENVEIKIVITNPNNSSIEPGKICLLTSKRGNFRYITDDSKSELLKTIYEETFFEAQKKVN
jgi:hypothetical protein